VFRGVQPTPGGTGKQRFNKVVCIDLKMVALFSLLLREVLIYYILFINIKNIMGSVFRYILSVGL